LGSEKIEKWEQTKIKNIWYYTSKLSNPWGPARYEAEIFFLKNDSTSWGTFQDYNNNLSNLKKEYDWTWNRGRFYIYSPTNPSIRYDSVEVPQRLYCIKHTSNKISYILIDGIDLFYAKAAGYYSGYPAVKNATDISIKNCRIGYIAHKGARRGYGIVVFQSNLLIDNCYFSDCGRRAISFNLYRKQQHGDERYISNVVVRNCFFKRGYHTTSLDFASTGDQNKYYHGDTLVHIYFYNNFIDDSEIKMKDKDKTSNQLFFQEGGSYMNDIYIFNNIFVKSTGRNILIEGCDTVHVWNNTIVAHNPARFFRSVYANVSFNYTRNIDYRNNILYSNWPNNELDNWGVLMQHKPSRYIICDNNLYYQEFQDPKHNGFTGGLNGYFTINMWRKYIFNNPTLDQHSPFPAYPEFHLLYNDFHLKSSSPAIKAGQPLKHIFIDPEKNTIAIGTFDFDGITRDTDTPSLGAYEFNPQ